MKKVLRILLSSFALISLVSCVNTQSTSSSEKSSDSSIIPISITSSKEADVYYIVTFLNYDDSVLGTDRVKEGEEAHYRGTTPTKPEDDEFKYEFEGWDKDLKSITSDMTTKAQYKYVAKENWSHIYW